MKTRKLLALSIVAIASTASLASCGGKQLVEDEDETKTQLKVKYNNGGFGSEWLDKLCDEFATQFAETSFQPGRKGVQIIKDYDKRNVGYESVRGNDNHVLIQEDTDYFTYLSKGTMLDITDVVTDYALQADGTRETERKIEDKMNDTYKSFYNYRGKYYAVPLFETNVGLQYNVSVFEKKNLFFREGATAESFTEEDFSDLDKLYSLFIDDEHTTRSTGPDGQTGVVGDMNYSIDDGLPATYKDFRALLEMMKNSSVTPFIWNNTCSNYLTSLINDVWSTNQGAEEFLMNFKLEGTANELVKIQDGKVQRDANGKPVVESVTVGANNYAELQRQRGKLEALDFAQYLCADGNYYSKSWQTSYTDAQEYFINPQNHKAIGDIGFIVEGGWWFREASDFFSPGTQKSAKFSPFILPKVSADRIGTPNVRVSDRRSLMFINNYCPSENLEVAKKFLSFINSDHALQTYTQYTHAKRGMEYDLPDDVYNQMSYYGKAAWDISRHTNTITLPWLPLTDLAKEHVLELDYAAYGFSITSGDGNPVMNFNDWAKKGTPKTSDQYFVDIYNYKK